MENKGVILVFCAYLEENEPVESHSKRDNKEHISEWSTSEEEEMHDCLEVDAGSSSPLGPAPGLVARIQHTQGAENTDGDTEISLVVFRVILVVHGEWYL